MRALTNSSNSDQNSSDSESLESRKTAFKTATTQYFALLSSIDVRLRRQVYALEEASIIQPESAVKGNENVASSVTASGSINSLDVSWLNSRKDTVGKDKEAEIWAEASKFVKKLEGDETGQTNEQGTSQEKMQTD